MNVAKREEMRVKSLAMTQAHRAICEYVGMYSIHGCGTSLGEMRIRYSADIQEHIKLGIESRFPGYTFEWIKDAD